LHFSGIYNSFTIAFHSFLAYTEFIKSGISRGIYPLKELSIFIDESGDFGRYCHHSPYYIITMVFHDQNKDVRTAIAKLNMELSYLGLCNPVYIPDQLFAEKNFMPACPSKKEDVSSIK